MFAPSMASAHVELIANSLANPPNHSPKAQKKKNKKEENKIRSVCFLEREALEGLPYWRGEEVAKKKDLRCHDFFKYTSLAKYAPQAKPDRIIQHGWPPPQTIEY